MLLAVHGTVRVSGLSAGTKYELYRFDGTADAFDYSKAAPIHTFAADGATLVFKDPKGIPSDGVTYYRCVTAT